MTTALSADVAIKLKHRGLRLEYATLAWNVVGSVVVIASALLARSVALAGFGVDSLIEIFASLVVVWQLTGADPGRERLATRLIGFAFFVLALYIFVQSVSVLIIRARPETSLPGIVWLTLTLVAMLLLAWGKRATGRELGNAILVKEGYVTFIDACLAAAVLCGLVANAAVGWWWADPLAALVVVYYGVKEGAAALSE